MQWRLSGSDCPWSRPPYLGPNHCAWAWPLYLGLTLSPAAESALLDLSLCLLLKQAPPQLIDIILPFPSSLWSISMSQHTLPSQSPPPRLFNWWLRCWMKCLIDSINVTSTWHVMHEWQVISKSTLPLRWNVSVSSGQGDKQISPPLPWPHPHTWHYHSHHPHSHWVGDVWGMWSCTAGRWGGEKWGRRRGSRGVTRSSSEERTEQNQEEIWIEGACIALARGTAKWLHLSISMYNQIVNCCYMLVYSVPTPLLSSPLHLCLPLLPSLPSLPPLPLASLPFPLLPLPFPSSPPLPFAPLPPFPSSPLSSPLCSPPLSLTQGKRHLWWKRSTASWELQGQSLHQVLVWSSWRY